VVFISGFQKLSGPWDQLINFSRTSANARVKYRLIADALASPVTLGGPINAEPVRLAVARASEEEKLGDLRCEHVKGRYSDEG
jgi:hypothetical protein